MKYTTEAHIIAHIEDANIFQINKIGKFLNSKHLQFGFDYVNDAIDGTHLYNLTADVTGHTAEFYMYLDSINK